MNAAQGEITDENPDGIPYYGADKLPPGTASELQLRVVELEQALFFKEKDFKKINAELSAKDREIALLMRTNRKLQGQNEKFFPDQGELEIQLEPEIVETTSEVQATLLTQKSDIIDSIAATNLNEKSAEDLFNEFVSLANSVCPDGATKCGYVTLVPSWSEYLQPRQVNKFGAIVLNMDTKEVILPF